MKKHFNTSSVPRSFINSALFNRGLLLLGLALFLRASIASGATQVLVWGSNVNGERDVPPDLTNATVVASGPGASHVLAIRPDGTVVGWGANGYGQATPPAGLANVKAVSAGAGHSLALKTDGSVIAWGDNSSGQTNVPAGLGVVTAIAAGANHSLALKSDGTVVGWGRNVEGQITIPSGLGVVTNIGAGTDHSLAIKANGYPVAWGLNDVGQATVPTTLSNVVKIVGGRYHSLALKTDGRITAWGTNGGTKVPVGLNNNVSITSGEAHGLSLVTSTRVFVWGNNTSGQTNAPYVVTNALAVAAGRDFSIALTLPLNAAPIISSQPTNQSVGVGANASFNVSAVGTGPFTYFWFGNSTLLSVKPTSSLTVSNVQPSMAGNYYVVVSNSFGTVTSSNAVLTALQTPPAITTQPLDRIVYETMGTNFTVNVTGALPMSYQWYLGSDPVANGTNKTLLLNGITASQAGYYSVVVTNAYGATNSAAGLLTVLVAAPAITADPQDVTVTPPTNVTFTVAASGISPRRFQWLFNGIPIAGRTAATLNLTNVQASHAGFYSAVVTNAFGSATSAAAQLSISSPQPSPPATPAHSFNAVPSANGGVLLQFNGDADGVYNVQASTDLVDWVTIGTVVADGTGACEYEDPDAMNFPSRFYRIAIP